MWKFSAVLLFIVGLHCEEFGFAPEIDYSDGLQTSLESRPDIFDTLNFENDTKPEVLLRAAAAIDVQNNSQGVRMVIPKKIKEIDARQMKNVREFKDNLFGYNYTSIADVFNFYSTEKLIRYYDQVNFLIGPSCQKDLEEYFEGLRDGTSWALKSK